MKTSPVEQFVREYVTEFRRTGKKWNSRLDLYDKNGKYCGDYHPRHTNHRYSDYFGKRVTISQLHIFDGPLNKTMQKIVCQKKDNVEVKDHTREIPTRVIPQTITTITTFFDFVNDTFKTVERKSVLQNELTRIGKDDPDFYYNEDHAIYEEIKDKLVYKQEVRVRREGSISEVKKQEHINLVRPRGYKESEFLGYPFIFW